jgi:N4-(beta-N-acetylglucosaminyl)-L-asparaginase
MHGPKKRAGGVAAIEGVRTPSLVAKAVLENTDHHLIVGKGAQDFARNMGFTIEADLNHAQLPKAMAGVEARIDPEHYLDPKKRDEAGRKVSLQMMREGLLDPGHYYGTINCDGVNAKGEVCG